MKKFSKILIAITLIAGIALLAIPTGAVFAQDESPPADRTPVRRRQKDLSDLFEEIVDRYDDMGYAIEDTDDVVRKLENWMEALEEKGEDPSGVQIILDAFLTNMDAVEAAYEEAGALIATHPGFDSQGNVIDESLALDTLRSIAEALLDVHQLGEDAKLALKWDVMAYRYQHAPED